MTIKGTEKIEKRNVVNEIRKNNMTLQALRFFSIYLAKINAREPSTSKVRFLLEDFQKIMDIDRMNIQHFKNTVDSLLCNIIHLVDKDNGLTSFQLFKKCTLKKDDFNLWYVEIDAHEDALPLLFEFKDNYFTYELWNTLRLTSSNQLRMYEILKQYEKIGTRKISLIELKELIGLSTIEYPRWDRFKDRILESCKKSLAENTDITYTYEPIKNGRGGKITDIKFNIIKNKDYKNKLKLDEFINLKSINNNLELEIRENKETVNIVSDDNKILNKFENENLEFLSDACNYEFSETQMQEIFLIIANKDDLFTSTNSKKLDLERYNYLQSKYANLNTICEQKKNAKDSIKNRFAYFKKILV